MYWTAVRDTFPDAWGKPPTQSRLMHGTGIRAMGRLMDRLMAAIDLGHADAPAQIRAELALLAPRCRWTSGRWEELDLRWNQIENLPSPQTRPVQLPHPRPYAGQDRSAMKFFFPDSQDQIDPGFDFSTEEHPALRVRQRDDLYAHEALDGHIIDGLLVSKAIVDGTAGSAGKYTGAQRNRLYRVGVRRFFRLDQTSNSSVQTMGDCGAFSYIDEEVPPVTPDQVIDFYAECGFDLGISVDHVIFGFDPAADADPHHPQAEQWLSRQQITLELADVFLTRSRAAEGPVRTSRRSAGMESGFLCGGGPQPPENWLPPYCPWRHGSAQDARNTCLPPSSLGGSRTGHATSPAGHHEMQ